MPIIQPPGYKLYLHLLKNALIKLNKHYIKILKELNPTKNNNTIQEMLKIYFKKYFINYFFEKHKINSNITSDYYSNYYIYIGRQSTYGLITPYTNDKLCYSGKNDMDIISLDYTKDNRIIKGNYIIVIDEYIKSIRFFRVKNIMSLKCLYYKVKKGIEETHPFSFYSFFRVGNVPDVSSNVLILTEIQPDLIRRQHIRNQSLLTYQIFTYKCRLFTNGDF